MLIVTVDILCTATTRKCRLWQWPPKSSSCGKTVRCYGADVWFLYATLVMLGQDAWRPEMDTRGFGPSTRWMTSRCVIGLGQVTKGFNFVGSGHSLRPLIN